MLQLTYISSASPGAAVDPQPILATSRRNNARDGITGLLYFDGVRFLQVLEGPDAQVRAAVDRIRADTRHRAIVILSQRQIQMREFGNWDMAHYGPGADVEAFLTRIADLTADAAPNVRATFEGLARVRRAA
jgi:hypothetical protein